MTSRVSNICDRALEAGWLLAVVLMPLHFNIYTSRTFEPDKLSILRALALFMLSALVVRTMEGSLRTTDSAGFGVHDGTQTSDSGHWASLIRMPLVLPALLFLAACFLSTSFSILPGISIWGSYTRLQGAYSMFCYGVVFFSILTTLSRKSQVDRLIDTLILASVPATLYAILQHYGMDPTSWSMDMKDRPGANMGNPIFLAAYLMMVVPLTLYKIMESLRQGVSRLRRERLEGARTACYLLAALFQVSAILFTQSRGPWLGLFGGLSFFVLVGLIIVARNRGEPRSLSFKDCLKAFAFSICSAVTLLVPAYLFMLLRRRGIRWLWLAFVFQILFLIAFVAALNIPSSPLKAVRDLPYVGRLGHLSEAEAGTAKVRAIIWRGTIELIASSPARMIIGYGPETMKYVWDPYSPPELAHHEAKNAAPDRSHNETYDLIVSTGLVGLAAYMFFLGSIVFAGLKWLDFVRTRAHTFLLLALMSGGTAAGIIVPRLALGTYAFTGVGIPAGFTAGLFLYVAFAPLFRQAVPEAGAGINPLRSLLILSLLSGIIAHFVEIQIGIAVGSTRLYFFVYTALLVMVGLGLPEEIRGGIPGPSPAAAAPTVKEEATGRRSGNKGKKKPSGSERGKEKPVRTGLALPFLPFSILSAAVLFAVGCGFMTNRQGETDPFGIISAALTTVTPDGDGSFSFAILFLLCLTFAFGLVFTLHDGQPFFPEEKRAPKGPGKENSTLLTGAGLYASVTVAAFLAGMVIEASLVTPDGDASRIIPFHYLALLLFLAGLTAFLPGPARPVPALAKGYGRWLYPIIPILALVAAYAISVQPVRADVYAKAALSFEQRQQWDTSVQLYGRALGLAPGEDFYYLSLGRALFGKAAALPAGREKDEVSEQIREAMEKAHRINPRNTDHLANMGLLYLKWAEGDPSPSSRAEKLKKAHIYYGLAAQGSPRKTIILNNWARVYAAEGDYKGATAKLTHSLTIDDRMAPTYFTLGELYATTGDMAGAIASYRRGLELEPGADAYAALGYVYFRDGKVKEATEASLKALSIDPGVIKAHSLLSLIYYKSGRLKEAIEENLAIVRVSPRNVLAHRNLTVMYEEMGQIDKAVEHMEKVVAYSPAAEKSQLVPILDRLKAKAAREHPRAG